MIPTKFKFGVLTEKGHAEVRESELHELKPDELLVKQEACNICTTDYQQWLGLREHQGYPMAGGHEGSGIVIAKGDKVGNFEIGDRVSILYDYCGICDNCKAGMITICQNKKLFGKNYHDEYFGIFGFSNYFIRNAKSFVKMNVELSPSEAGFVEPLGSVLHGLRKIRLQGGFDTVVVIGGGTMGLLNAAAARAMGARVIVSGRGEKKLEIGRKMGFEMIDAGNCYPIIEVKKLTNGRGADAVIVSAGTTIANQQALEMAKGQHGRILFYAAGFPLPELNVDSNVIHYKNLELIGTFGSTLEDFNNAGRMLSERRIDVSYLIEEKVPLSNIQEAFKKASTKGNFRISVMLHE
ncbi:zinc-dependent alcohol dehydrogenase [Metabacillus arenae]|uniref:Alcohol dehydrogenase catalytic domain-containing protein n=1 Tax=Metabacillus arenae TaxID=2771434 RepID=A0A926RYZ3_9BACI|nr:alcohol dehydrogenase catalytic domain-containing protein [Metabacillus arenae]MBD1383493.1 alcohol dehydrogenase catalytic domain-containing protein [Metabacillus arenae]